MRSATRFSLLITALAAAAAPQPARAQAAPAKPGSVFKELVKQPTGKNGYEELLLAAELLQSSNLWKKAEAGRPTLSEKRLVLSDKPVIRALALIRQGLSKPVLSLREEITVSQPLPELNRLRSLARLLAMQQYVLLADGRTGEAIEVARVGMRLGQVIQQDSLVSGLVGISIGSACIRSLAAHLDQLSVRDCDLLRDVCLEWLTFPDPLPRVLHAERKVVLSSLAEFRKLPGEAAIDPAQLDATSKAASELFDRLIAETRKRPWERQGVDAQEASDLARALLTPIAQSMSASLNAYTREEANVRQLALHALILRYRWHHDRLPTTLEELNPGELHIDPFTGKPLIYETQGRGYRLYSAGPLAQANDPQAVNGRRPVSVVPE